MKIEITKEIENQIDAMIGVALQVKKIKDESGNCWNILKSQYLPETGYNEKPILDTEENLKIRLYAEIMRKKNETEVKVGNKLK